MAEPLAQRDSPAVFPRAIFLACSWTWVIGMFFPVYLVAEFGAMGWVAFAVPNVLGSIAMGLEARRVREGFESEHGRAMRAFSLVTICFHVAFLSWFLAVCASKNQMVKQGYVGPIIALVLFTIAWGLARLGMKQLRTAAIGAFVLSLLCGMMAWRTSDTINLPPRFGPRPIGDLGAALPILALGFFRCPWLDLSYWRVRRETPGRAGDLAFILGFSVFFLAMIALTLLYAGAMAKGSYSLYILVHIAIQSVFTIAVHLRCRADSRAMFNPNNRDNARPVPLDWSLVFVVALGLCFGPIDWLPEYRPGYRPTRMAYELFMSFYALVFPAYAWIVMRHWNLPSRTRTRTWLFTTGLATPMLWMGYIEKHSLWLLPTVGIVLLAPLIARAVTPRSDPPFAA
ncbi:MAG TPA: hypothetical protein VG797_06915 [Phycisphaerales bacterium]|nr:hypothetical protein [Phycisphaerales bacterium]